MFSRLITLSKKEKIICFCLILSACFGCVTIKSETTHKPTSELPAKALTLSDDAYPSDWHILPCTSNLCRNGDASYEQTVIPNTNAPGQLFQEVYRFQTIKDASEKFLIYKQAEYHKEQLDQNSTDFLPPLELPYVSNLADEYYFACGQSFGLVCKMIARYKNYFVFFYFDMDSGNGYGLNYQEVKHILVSMDQHVIDLELYKE